MKTKYKKYEFCKSKGCIGVQWDDGKLNCPILPEECLFTAKEFHHWLESEGFEIVEREKRTQ